MGRRASALNNIAGRARCSTNLPKARMSAALNQPLRTVANPSAMAM